MIGKRQTVLTVNSQKKKCHLYEGGGIKKMFKHHLFSKSFIGSLPTPTWYSGATCINGIKKSNLPVPLVVTILVNPLSIHWYILNRV